MHDHQHYRGLTMAQLAFVILKEPGIHVIGVAVLNSVLTTAHSPPSRRMFFIGKSYGGGRGGIRTHGGFNPTLDFESSALNRTQPPFRMSAAGIYRRHEQAHY